MNAFCKQIHHDRRENLPVSLDRHAILDGHHRESDAPGVGLQCCGRHELVDESGNQELLPILNALGETDLGERTTDEIADSHEAPLEHRPGAPCDSHIPRLEHLERDHRGVDQVPQFMSQEPEALAPARGLSIEGELISSAPVLGDGARDGVVKASVQHAKVIRADGRVDFHRQLGDGLTDVAIIVHDL